MQAIRAKEYIWLQYRNINPKLKIQKKGYNNGTWCIQKKLWLF